MTTTNSATTAPLSLTRRGRLVLIGVPALLAVGALLAALLMLSLSAVNHAQATTAEHAGVDAVEVSVAPGDTLWSLADAAPTDDPIREVMAQISEMNSLDSAELQPGEVLYIPAD